MLVVSFVTIITSDKNLYEIKLAITALGLAITCFWFYVNAGLSVRIKKLKDDYLLHDPIYNTYMESIKPKNLTPPILAYFLPYSIILFWIFMMVYTIFSSRLDIIFECLIFSGVFLLIIFYKLYRWLPKSGGICLETKETNRELILKIIKKLDIIEKKSIGRFIMSMGFVLIAASIALWGWGMKSQPIDMLYYGFGWIIYIIGFIILIYGIYKTSKKI